MQVVTNNNVMASVSRRLPAQSLSGYNSGEVFEFVDGLFLLKNVHLISAQVAISNNVRESISDTFRAQILSRYTSPEVSELVDVPGRFSTDHIDIVQIPTFEFMP